ncbi:hypothetical protein BJ165DRAFT_1610991 [Panaeolus papilionaceus]|nr:hypothetical protein BJ165DRAFT_1610991 [Panaeolus papilionaceus]
MSPFALTTQIASSIVERHPSNILPLPQSVDVQYLISLPLIESLFINDSVTQVAGLLADSPPAEDLCKYIIQSYISKPNLQCLIIEDYAPASNLPYAEILASTTLKEFRLMCCHKPPANIPLETNFGPQLQRLTLHSRGMTSWILPRCTSITDLSLRGSIESSSFRLSPTPSFELIKFSIQTRLDIVFDSFWATNRLGFKPISTLEQLSIDITASQTITANKMFEGLPRLRILNVHSLHDLSGKNLIFSDLQLDRHLRSSFPALNSISFDMCIPRDAFQSVLSNLVASLTSISFALELTIVNIKATTVAAATSPPPDDFYLSLYELLDTLMKFKSLHEVAIEFKFIVDKHVDGPTLEIMDDGSFFPLMQWQIKGIEMISGLKLHIHFSPAVATPLFAHRMAQSRAVLIHLYPPQNIGQHIMHSTA